MADTSYPAYLFHQGRNFYSYDFLGANLEYKDEKYHYTFRVWAPRAAAVGLISEFSGWEFPIYMTKVSDGIFELNYDSDYSLERKAYKYLVYSKDGAQDKGDPYARFSKGGWDGASLVFTEKKFGWSDYEWMQTRKERIALTDASFLQTPINIYEMHLGSYIRHFDNRYYSYRELAEILPPYLREMGYTHVEFMPVQEHPYDGSWGYQVCGFFAPTSRFGDPDDFRYLIDRLHAHGIGVILDWICAHFPKDKWGLSRFDGDYLYEYADEKRREADAWRTSFFDLGKYEVQSFLISSALYFLREFHIDGLRVDAVSSIISFDNRKCEPDFVSQENADGIEFFRKLNSAISHEFPDVLMIAEESTSFGNVTSPVFAGGLGFNLRWNMGWASDFFDYVSTDPLYRHQKHQALTFPLVYAFSEKHCMPISHDAVSLGRGSFLGKMFGGKEDKLAMARLSLMLMMTYPGKKLTFMGVELATSDEWNYDNELPWYLLSFEEHRRFKEYVKELNHFYLLTPSLWQVDFSERGFKWIYPDEAWKNLVVFKRISAQNEEIVVVLNFSGTDQSVTIPARGHGFYDVMFDTGNFVGGPHINIHYDDVKFYANLTLPKFSGIIMRENNENYF